MKTIIGLVCLAFLALPASAQSVCQLRTQGGNVWAATPSASEPWGHLTFASAGDFFFDYPGEEGASEITTVTAIVPVQFVGGVKSVWGSDNQWHPWEDDGVRFSGYIVKRSTGAYSEPFDIGPVHLKLTTAFDTWRTAVTVQRYLGVDAVLVHLSLSVRVCGNESQLRTWLDDFDARQAVK